MSKRFIKFNPGDEADWLQENQPNAFLLLVQIAKRARRTTGLPDGLEIGEALIGDFKKAGIDTRGKYRHALAVLEKRAHIKIIENCRNRQKATTGTTTIGTKVTLLTSSVWDVNINIDNHPHDHRTTTEQPPNNHEQERNKKEKEVSVLFVNAQAREKTENEKQAIVDSLVAKGHTRPDAMAAMSIYEKKQPELNGTIEKYVEGILTNKKKEKHYAKPNHQRSTAKRNASKRESEQDLIERSRETLRIPSCRGPCDTEQEARGSLDGIYSGPFMRQM